MSNLNLGVDVVSARNLSPTEGKGSSTSAFVELTFDGQRFCTTSIDNDLNPVWNENFVFNISNPSNLNNLTLLATVYQNVRATNSKSMLGKVSIYGNSFVQHGDAVVLHYPLKMRGIFASERRELALKVYIIDDFNLLPNPDQQQDQYGPSAPPVSSHGTTPPELVNMYRAATSGPDNYALKETSPILGVGRVVGGRVIRGDQTASSNYDLVEQMVFLFVKVAKARELPVSDISGAVDPFVIVETGKHKVTTNHVELNRNPEWNKLFAFSRERIKNSMLDITVMDKDIVVDDFVGRVRFDIRKVPMRVSTDNPLAPRWYQLEDKKGEKTQGDLMLSVWFGTQEDEVFPDAWHCDPDIPIGIMPDSFTAVCSKVYHAPRLWHVCVNVIEAEDLVPAGEQRFPEVCVKAQIGNQVLRTKISQPRGYNALWNENLLFVTAEPFEDPLILSVEDRLGPGQSEVIGRVFILLSSVEKHADAQIVNSRWYDLEKPISMDAPPVRRRFDSRVHLRVHLDGGYHVDEDPTQFSGDLRPTAKQLWSPPIGLLELGILNAVELLPMKTRNGMATSDTYCVAKYANKWVRTRTVIGSLNPRYNEQYDWEVFDRATVLTVGIFDRQQFAEKKSDNKKDARIGKVRIRISTLESGRIYTHSYPLLVLHPSGVKKMGELHLAIRFTCKSFVNMLYQCSRPLLPKMHYIRPISVMQSDMLRHQAMNIVASRFGQAEPPLQRSVVEYMSNADYSLWCLRKSKANFFRLMSLVSGLVGAAKWFDNICKWKNPITTLTVHVLYLIPVCFPEWILPIVFLYVSFIGLWNYRYRPRHPSHLSTKQSYAEDVHPDELDEEFDTFPTSRPSDLVRMRYDRLRSIAGRVQNILGDVVVQGEKFQSLLSWRDPYASAIFLVLCTITALVLLVIPLKVVAALTGFYMMRHPRFRDTNLSRPVNFFRRLPSKIDSLF